jgi:SnoaL-like domain
MKRSYEERIQILEDIEAIKKLKASYCYWADAGITGDGSKMDELIAHFTDDEPWADFGPFGVHRGKEAVAAFFKGVVVSSLSYSAHMVCNPIIEVDGNRATGKWYVDVPCTLRGAERPAWLQARYEEEYVKEAGEWKWKSITTRFDFITPFDEGWVKTPMITM